MSASEPPAVTAIIPAYNRAEQIDRAIRSVMAQRPHPPAELIVVDDGSTDGTATVAEAAGARVIRHDHNRGSAAARNTAVEAAMHKWIAPLDSDDEWLPIHLATLFPLRTGYVFAAGASLTVTPGNGGAAYAGPQAIGEILLRSPSTIILENFVPASGVIFDAEVCRAVGGYSEHRRNAEDFDLWLRMLERGTALCIPEPVSIYHRHAGQKSQGGHVTRERVRAMIDSYEARPWCTPAVRERRRAADAWDDLNEAVRRRMWPRAAASLRYLVAHPRRMLAVSALVRRRAGCRRHSSEAASRLNA